MKYPAPKGPIIEPKPDSETAGVVNPEAEDAPAGEDAKEKSPVRYGDWEINGRCIDF